MSDPTRCPSESACLLCGLDNCANAGFLHRPMTLYALSKRLHEDAKLVEVPVYEYGWGGPGENSRPLMRGRYERVPVKGDQLLVPEWDTDAESAVRPPVISTVQLVHLSANGGAEVHVRADHRQRY